MTKTIFLASIAATTVLILSLASVPAFGPGPPKVCDQIDDLNCTFSMTWDFLDTGFDPGPPLVITIVNGNLDKIFGEFTPLPVEGNLQGSLVGTIKTIFEDTTTTGTTTTTTTTVTTQSRNANNLQGEFVIGGVPYSTTIKTPGYNANQVGINAITSGPSISRTDDQTIVIIPIVITMCPQDKSQCLQGYGTVERISSISIDGVSFVSFEANNLEATVIGQEGLFVLGLSYLQVIQGPL